MTALSYEKEIDEIIIVNRSSQNASILVQHGLKLGLNIHKEDFNNLPKIALESDLIVNATSIGLNNESSPIGRDNINPKGIVYDIVYKPIITDLLGKAKDVNAKVIYGYEMLLAQGAQAFKIWILLQLEIF